MTVKQHSKTQEIYSHTGLRGVAAMGVVTAHFFLSLYNNEPRDEIGDMVYSLAGYAVDLFFTLSGFILNWVYVSKSDYLKWGEYLMARCARILPLYYLTTLLAIPLIYYSYLNHGFKYIGNHSYTLDFISNIFLFQSLVGSPSFNGPAWSISVEFFCYLTIFPALVFINNTKLKKYNIIFQIVLAIITTHLLVICYNWVNVPIFKYKCNFSYLARGILGFILGFLICNIYRKSSSCMHNNRINKIILFFAFGIIITTIYYKLSIKYIIYSIPLVVYFSAFDRGVSFYILKSSPIQWMGKRSYSLYLIHALVLTCFPSFIKKILHHLSINYTPSSLICFFIFATIVFIISELSYRYYEVPFRGLIRNT
jgi:peptidoglycan/LPS O-acetylase OafA/YrhL